MALLLALGVPSIASAAAPATKVLIVQAGSPLAEVQSNETVPLHFSSSAREAVIAAEESATLRALHRRLHPLSVVPYVWRSQHPYWFVVFRYRGKTVADANVSPSGKLTRVFTGVQAISPDAQGGFAEILTGWWILLPASILFLLPFLDPRRLRRIAHLDALAVLSFLVSWLLVANAHLEAAVWTVYPPLFYLLARLLMIGFGRSRGGGRLAPLLPTRILIVGLPLLLGLRILASLLGHNEIDVGYESVIGAYRVLHHLPIYWNDPNHGDTYGPIAYLAYVPFDLLFPWKNSLSSLHGADLAAIVFDLGTVGGLILLGRRLRTGADGTRLGLLLAWAWAACPFTIIGLIVHTNDGLVAMLTVFALVAIGSPVVSGGLLGLAAAAKFSPAALLPLMASPPQRGVKRAAVCVAAFAAVVVTALLSWLPSGGLSYLWHRTIEFQMMRPDAFSPWGLHPVLHPVQVALEVFAVALVGAVAFVPRERSLLSVCALAGAVTIAIQLPAIHWYYFYIMWFMPFAVVALLLATREQAAVPVEGSDEQLELRTPGMSAPEPALVGA